MAATYFKYMVFGKAKDHELHSKSHLLQRKRWPFRMPQKISVLSNGYGYRSR